MFSYNPDKFREIDHTADIGLRAEGDTLPELFANLAFGMIHIIAGNAERPKNTHLLIEVREKSEADLIVSWLSEINYHLTVHHFLLSEIKNIKVDMIEDGCHLKANLTGTNILHHHTELRTEIKAVTYHQLIFEKIEGVYVGQVIFDI